MFDDRQSDTFSFAWAMPDPVMESFHPNRSNRTHPIEEFGFM